MTQRPRRQPAHAGADPAVDKEVSGSGDETTSPTRRLAVLDIDGVLADVRHRLHHVDARPKDWDAFFAAAPADPPLHEGVELATALAAEYEVVYLTGRPERCRADTLSWLARHGLPAGRLLMRSDGDRRPARMTKLAELRRLGGPAAVAVVVDDDPAVCAALAGDGWPVYRADWMDRPETLDAAQERDGRT